MTVTSTSSPGPVEESPTFAPDTEPCVKAEFNGVYEESSYPNFDGWGATGHPARTARTTVTVEPAALAEVEKFPLMAELEKYVSRPDAPPAESKFVKISIVHTVQLNSGDPLLADVRSTKASKYSTAFIQGGLGHIDTDDSTAYLETFFFPPKVTPDSNGGAVVTVRGLGYSRYPEETPLLGLELGPFINSGSYDEPAVNSHAIHIRFKGWDVAGVAGQVPAKMSTGALDVVGGPETRIALVRSGEEVPDLIAYLQEGGTLTDAPATLAEEADPDLTAARELLLISVTVVALIVLIVQWLGRAWWRRRLNRFLAGGIVVLLAASIFVGGAQTDVAWLIWAALVCVLAVNHAVRRLGWPRWPRRDVLIGSAVLLAAGVGLTALAVGQGVEHIRWPAVLLVVGVPVLFGVIKPLRRMALPVAGVAIAAVGVILAVSSHALDEQFDLAQITGTLIWLVILAAAIAVSAGGWTGAQVLVLLLATIAVYVAQWALKGTLDWPALAANTAPLLLLILLVLRLRRLGQRSTAVASSETRASVAFVAVALHLYPASFDTIGIAALVALAAVWWLLSGTASRRSAEFATITAEAHAAVVGASLRRRFMRLALRHLYRTGRARLGTGDMTVAAFEEQRTALERAIAAEASDQAGTVHPDLAFATSGGRTPWQNGVAGFLVAFAVTVPITLVYKQPFSAQSEPVAYLIAVRTIFGLPLFGLIYGYFYPRIRGDSPLSKAAHVLVATLAIEVAALLPRFVGPEPPGDKLRLLAIVLAEVTLLALTLGLFWEWRLMRIAREPWHRIRGLRSVRGLAAPLSALAIAAVTTIGAPFAARIAEPPEPSLPGVGGVPRIEAERFTRAARDVRVENTSDITGGQSAVAGIGRGDRLAYEIDFGTSSATRMRVRLASSAPQNVGGRISVLLDDSANSIGVLGIPNTGGWQTWKTVEEDIAPVTGKHTVVLAFSADQPGDMVSINWIEFK
ncbi:carbohydrate-binding protein [Acrocarpospora catenulata]|uniref:carbohydrate-binding protein n=1 Tax=Acrocarpospora catenulata TaxID=2836182 RepID=UPI001BDA96B0|nr:carbohydrate-binding protein [Acrocarpospora catenulata]